MNGRISERGASRRRTRTRGSATTVLLAVVAIAIAACRPDAPSGPSDTRFSVTLEWTAPGVDARGAPLADLAGYTVHYRATSPADGPGGTQLDSGMATRQRIDGLTAGTWYFGVRARDLSGNESELSEELRVELGP